ncbi:MAG TPA: hypothetical protein VFU13_20610 [Steroidobacteraceae bacterium]|nr:hypothetical protein [Steroidobacteraceae bacterium]
MPRLILKDGNRFLGAISDADVKVLVDELEEEDMADDDYFIDGATVSILEAAGASSALVGMLLTAIGDSEGIDIRWEK